MSKIQGEHQPQAVSQINLAVLQTPAGFTDFNLLLYGQDNKLLKRINLQHETNSGDQFELSFPVLSLTKVRLTTIKSPSWVAWREVSFR